MRTQLVPDLFSGVPLGDPLANAERPVDEDAQRAGSLVAGALDLDARPRAPLRPTRRVL
jgi:hypothetical protein